MEEMQSNGTYSDYEKRLRRLCDECISSTSLKLPASKNDLRNLFREIITKELSKPDIQEDLESMVSLAVKHRENEIAARVSDSLHNLSEEGRTESQVIAESQSSTVKPVPIEETPAVKLTSQETALDLLDSFGVSSSATDSKRKSKLPKVATTVKNTSNMAPNWSDLGRKHLSNTPSESVTQSGTGSTGIEEDTVPAASDSEVANVTVKKTSVKELMPRAKRKNFLISSDEDVSTDDEVQSPMTVEGDIVDAQVDTTLETKDNCVVEDPAQKLMDSSGVSSEESSCENSEVTSSTPRSQKQVDTHSSPHFLRKRHASSSGAEQKLETVGGKQKRRRKAKHVVTRVKSSERSSRKGLKH
jgi:hypothetical protein